MIEGGKETSVLEFINVFLNDKSINWSLMFPVIDEGKRLQFASLFTIKVVDTFKKKNSITHFKQYNIC